MKELLKKLLQMYISGGEFSLVDALTLDKVLWSYHKAAAKSKGYQVAKGGWFTEFVIEFPQVEYQRSAVDIIVELLKQGKLVDIDELYTSSLKDLLTKLQE